MLYEVLNEAIILPLFFFIGNTINDKTNLTNKINLAGIASFSKVAKVAEKQDKENYIHFQL